MFQDLAALVCHRSADRTFTLGDGGFMPLCARCTGLYSGFAMGALAQVLTGSARVMPGSKTILLSVLLLATMLLQAVGEMWGYWAWPNAGRLGIGLVVGGVMSGLMVPLCRYFTGRSQPAEAGHRMLDVAVFVALLGLPLSVLWLPGLLSILAVVSLAGLLAAYGCMNLALAGAVLQFKNQAGSRGRTLSLIALTLLLFVCEGGFFSLIQPKT